MLQIIKSATVLGLDATEVEIEVDVSQGLPGFTIVGLPDTAVQESRERVRAAIHNSEFDYRQRRLTVNLAPADLRKEGPAFDLPIAVGVLAASNLFTRKTDTEGYWLVGELSLKGTVKPVKGILSIALAAASLGVRGLLVPADNAEEAAVIEEVDVFPVRNLREAVGFMAGEMDIKPAKGQERLKAETTSLIDFSEIKGQLQARRAVEIAAAGDHNILMIGPPGAGKTMLAARLPTIMTPLSRPEAIEVTKIQSVSGVGINRPGLVWKRPFRSPHHTISYAGLVGGGSRPTPGEITLSHKGILFLDELAQFGPSLLQSLRQPLESKVVTISRSNGRFTFPAGFMLVGAMNPCPCGYLGDGRRECVCSLGRIRSYRSRVSGPLLDRIDIQMEVPRLSKTDLIKTVPGEASVQIRARVIQARAAQTERFGDADMRNSFMSPGQVREFCRVDPETRRWLETAVDKLAPSARGYDRLLKVARTIADISGRQSIGLSDVAEAFQYRVPDRGLPV